MASSIKEPRALDPSIIFGGVEATSEEQRTTYAAACHCGAVQFNVTLKWPFPKFPVNKYTCSVCHTKEYLLMHPCRRDITLTQGYDNLGSYKFNTKTKAHVFGKTCGTSIGIDFLRAEQGEPDPAKDKFAISVCVDSIHNSQARKTELAEKQTDIEEVRTFKELDLDSLEYTFFDGKNRIPYVSK